MAARSGAGTSRLTRRPRPGRLASSTVGSVHTSWPRCCRAGAVAARPTWPCVTSEEMARMRAIDGSYHVSLGQRLAIGDARVAEAREVNGLVAPVQDQFGDGAAGARPLLRAVAREPVGEIEVGDPGMRADDGVLVERVVVVEAGPGAHHLDALEGGHALSELRPHVGLEEGVV